MILVLCLAVGVLFACGVYMLMRRSLAKLVIGLAMLGHAANLLIFAVGNPVRGRPPLTVPGGTAPEPPFSDPLPSALILTAIVIGFGIVSFAIVLIKRAYQDVGTDDLDALTSTDR